MGSKRPVLDGMRMFEWLLLGVWVTGSVAGKWGCMGYTDVVKWLNGNPHGIKAAVEEIPYTITFSNIIPNITFPFHTTSSFTPSPPLLSPPHSTTKTPSKVHA